MTTGLNDHPPEPVAEAATDEVSPSRLRWRAEVSTVLAVAALGVAVAATGATNVHPPLVSAAWAVFTLLCVTYVFAA